MSSRADKKRKRRQHEATLGTFVVIDDVVNWPNPFKPLTKEQQERFINVVLDDSVFEPPTEQQKQALTKWATDTGIIRECRVDRPMRTIPGDILTASDRGRAQ